MIEQLKDEDLIDLFVFWPEGTKGYQEEKSLVLVLNMLCKKYGYGAVPQLAAWMEELWRYPDKREKFEEFAKNRKEDMLRVIAYYQGKHDD